MLFKNRKAAGQLLAGQLTNYANRSDVLVLALPRGGVPVAFEIAKALNAPLDVFPVRKLGVPDQRELAMGAIAPGDIRILNKDIIRQHHLFEAAIHQVAVREQREMERQYHHYRGDRPPLNVEGRTVIVVDDGLATGATMRVAILALRQQHPARLIMAVPVAAPEGCAAIGSDVEDIICAQTPAHFNSVGLWYEDFSPVSDETVCHLLEQAADSDRSSVAAG
jgi:putative phosphoribosyl transferase